ncbi:MAG: aromatic amino acid aminotransferase [Sphingomonas sp. SCN 67-18]|uniref:amino acid aminotransferase n=1 Tax=uncultured Sphingomonas sp. TaxID=158754 RepID=UPI00086B78C6|nr:aromatic amino acid transaminase [Sphingomonas sp. SCN 67-18]ODU22513.1 MAG: aromatic amino acid aminotransferase [Sphingomonas sp. SCN 67-18]
MSDPHCPFAALSPQNPDGLLALIAMHRADPRPGKIDLGVGIYRDADGRTPVMRAVKAAEARLLAEQPTKAYLGSEGDPRYAELIAELLLGPGADDPRRFCLQTPGGTGALRLGAELIARMAPQARVWIGDPTWPNHGPIFSAARLVPIAHAFFDRATGTIAFDAMMAALADARAGDVLLLHGGCHNPTGTQFSPDQWRALAQFCIARGLLPFIDLAYQGLGDGLDEDAGGVRLMVDAVPGAMIAYSCDKNFGLYRERVGALWIQAATPITADLARANLLTLARILWSMPPDHGAAVVRIILDDAALAQDWRAELTTMRARLNAVRGSLAAAHPALAAIAGQRGMFSLLPVGPDAVARLRQEHGIHMAGSGRINIAGLSPANLPRFTDALAACLPGDGAPRQDAPPRTTICEDMER